MNELVPQPGNADHIKEEAVAMPFRFSILLLAALLMLPAQSRAQEVLDDFLLIQNVPDRDHVSLDGEWGAVIDQYETGLYNIQYEVRNWRSTFFGDRKPTSPSDLIEYDFDAGYSHQIPGDWNTQDERLFLYEGTVWYKRAFDYQPKPNTRTFLHFGAVNYDATVAFNDEPLGHHIGGYTPFQFEVTDRVQEGENVVILKVDNKRHVEAVPTNNMDWWNYGGITRSVKLIEVPETFIEDYFIQLAPGTLNGDRGEIYGWVKLNGPDAAGENIAIRINELGVTVDASTAANGVAEFRVAVNDLEPWRPAHPKLYDVAVEGGGDAVADRIGFRTIETRGEDILLNGESIYMRGISIHEEVPYGDGRAHSREHAETLLGWVKDLNANFVRLAHYPHNETMVRLAEEMGILVWNEIPVYWTIQYDNPETYANAENQLVEMISRDKNRAAVVLWSVANETPIGDDRLTFLSRLTEKARALDPTRPITAALNTVDRDPATNTTHIRDPLGDVIDVIGINNYCAWYGSAKPEDCADVRWASDFGKPVIMSETGGGARAGLRGEPNERWTEDYMAAVYDNNLEMARNIPFLRGISPWILKDFRSPRRPLYGVQDFYNLKGVVGSQGEKKLAFYVLRDFYDEMEQEWPDR